MLTALLLLTGMGLWGQECYNTSIDLSTLGYENQHDLDGTPISVNHDVTLTFHKGTNSNTPKYFTTGTAVRCYGGNYFTVTTSSGYINSVTLTFGSGDGSNEITTDVGTFVSPTWTGNDATVNFTIGGNTGHRRIKALEIMYCTSGTPPQQTVATPTFNPAGGTYYEPQSVAIACTTLGATVRYTTDGNDPTENSTVYNAPLAISETTTLKAKAWKEGSEASEIAEATYTIEEGLTFNKVDNHTVSEGYVYLIVDVYSGKALTSANGTSSAPTAVSVTISNNQIVTGNSQLQWTFEATEGGYIIHPAGEESAWLYSTNANNGVRVGTNSDNVWELNVTDSEHPDYHGFKHQATSRYLGVYNNQDWRAYTSINTNIQNTQIELFVLGDAPQPTPTLTVSPNSLSDFGYVYGNGPSDSQTFTVSGTSLTESMTITASDNFAICFTASGTYTSSLTLVPVEGTISETTVYVRMIEGLDTGDYSGNVTAASGDINQTVALSGTVDALPVAATPTFSPEGGSYTEAQTVAISCETEGATVHYTLDGSDPTEGSAAYSEPLAISENTTVKARAWAEGYQASAIAEATYTINIPAPVEDYVRIHNVGNLVAGNRVILAARYDGTADAYLAIANTLTSGKLGTTAFTSLATDGGEVVPDDIKNAEDSFYWTVGVTEGGFTFSNASGETIAWSNGANFIMNGNASAWTIGTGSSGGSALVPDHYGFTIFNVNTPSRGFALRYFNENYVCGPYAENNMANGEYNFFLDIFMQGEPGTPIAATPTFSPAEGTYTSAQAVTIACETEGATIRYSLDGTDPTENSAAYSEPLAISENTTVKARAWMEGFDPSAIATATYTINIPEPALTVAPTALEGFSYAYGAGPSEAQTVSVAGTGLNADVTVTAPDGFEACLTADGTFAGSLTLSPQEGSLAATTVYVRMAAGLAVGGHTGILAVACGELSETVTLSGTVDALPVAATPTFSPEGGSYTEAQTVAISCETEGATVHYTLDGSDPTEGSAAYSEPLAISENTTVKAKAWAEGYQASAIAEATYTIQTDVPTVFNQDWEGEMNGWTFVDVEGEMSWTVAQHSGNHYAYANGFNHGTNIDWCISPAFDLADYTNPVLNFRTAKNYNGPDLEVYFSNDYDGQDPTTATWTPLTCALSQGSWNWVESGDIDLSGFSGSDCHIGFKYTSEESMAAGWEVDDITLTSQTSNPVITAIPTNLSGFTYTMGNGPSAELSFTVSGLNLTANLTVAGTTDFEISTTPGVNFNAQDIITLMPANGTIEPTPIYVRMKAGLTVGDYEDDILVASTGANELEITCSGTVVEQPQPGGDYIHIANASDLTDGDKVILAARYNENANAYLAIGNTVNSGKLSTTEFTITNGNGALPSSIVDNEDSYYWTVAVTDGGYTFTNANGQTIGYGNSGTNFVIGGEKTIWSINAGVSDPASLVPDYQGFNIANVANSGRAFALRVTETDRVVKAYATSNMTNGEYNFFLDIFMSGEAPQPTPQLAVTPTSLSNFSYAYGEGPSSMQTCTVSGTSLAENVTIAAPEHFEISLSASDVFGNSIVLEPTSGTLEPTTVYVRLMAGLDSGSYSGNLAFTSGELSANVALSGSVGTMPVAATPTFSVEGGTYLTPQTVSISTTTPDATIHYTTDGTDPTVSSAVYSTPIEVASSMTLKAMAVAENYNNSAIAEAIYTITEPQPISGIHNLPNNTYACMEGTVVMIDDRNVYVQDGTAGIDLYLNSNTVPAELALGDLVRAYGRKTVYNGLIELTGINGGNPNEFAILSSGNPLPLEVHTIAEINNDYNGNNLLQSTRVRIENAIIGTINYDGLTLITQDRAQMNIYHLPYVEGLSEGDHVNVNGVIGCYNAPQLLVASADDVEFEQGAHLTATPNSLSGLDYPYETGGPSEIGYFLLSGINLTDNASVYPSEHFEVSTYADDLFYPESPAIVYSTMGNFYDIEIYVRLKAGLVPGTYNDQLEIVSEGAATIYVTVSGTVSGDSPTPPPTPGDYVRISSLADLTAGSQVILAARYDGIAQDYVAIQNTLASGKLSTTEFTSLINEGNETIPASIADAESDYYWTVGITAEGYTFTNAIGDVIGYNSGTNFNMNGEKTNWTVSAGTSDPESMVPDHFGFTIINVAADSRGFALNNNHVVGAYSTTNMNGAGYNFFLDLFVKGEGGTPMVATPTFTPTGGTYTETQTVSISCTTEGATIHYTTDGTDPTESSPVYGTPLTISETTTVKAFAVKDGYNPSAIATATYVIQTGVATIFNQDWEGDLNGWTFVDVEGEMSWTVAQYQGNHYAYANGYNLGANIDWCISPAFNLNEIDYPVLSFRTAKNYTGPDLEVYFSNNYDGTDPTMATWTALTCALSQGSWNWVESGDIDLSGFSGTNCHIGFKYTSLEDQAAGWEVDDIMLVAQTTAPAIMATPTALAGFSYVEGYGPSAEQSFSVSAMNLTGNLSIQEATHYEISTSSGEDFDAEATITLVPNNGSISETTIFVRLKADLPAGNYSGETITLTSSGAAMVNVVCNGSVTPQGGQGGDYVRIANVSALQDGNKVILASRFNETDNAYVALANTLSSGKINVTDFSSVMNGAEEIIPADIVNSEDEFYWTVNVTADGYSFTNANGQTISYNSSTNFNFTGDKTDWTITTGISDEASLVPNHFGFNIVNVDTDTRAFALRVTETDRKVGAYSTSNMTNGEYNFFLDIFMQGEGGTPIVATPTFTPAGGTYYEAQEVTISCTTPDATIYYSLDSGSGPWYEYDEPITVSQSLTIWAYAEKVGYSDSPVASASYVIQNDLTIIFNQDWEEDWHGWTQVDVLGETQWDIASYQGNHYAYINGYNHGANEDWLISPAFDLDSYSDVVLTFRTAKNYTGNDLEVYFSNDYDGQDPTTVTWQELECELSQGGWNWVESGEISLNGFSGSNCHIAYKYTCNDEEAAAWEVDDIMLVAGGGSTNPYLVATPNALSGLTHIIDNGPSASQTFVLTGGNLPPMPGSTTGAVSLEVDNMAFEISLDGEVFGYQATIHDVVGILEPTTVYVRLNGNEIGTYEGAITIEDFVSISVSLSGEVLSTDQPTMTAIMPMYIQGNNGSNNNRVPMAASVSFLNFEPNTTYRYTNQFVDDNDGPETAGAGNVIYANENGFYRSTNPSLSTEGNYGEFTTDEEGYALVWLMNEPTANARFTPGNHVYLRVRVNDGHNGTTVDQVFTSEHYATVLNFGNDHGANQGTAFYVKSDEAPMSFALMYGDYNDVRPAYATSIEAIGVDYASINQYAGFYKDLVAGNDGWFGGILPNDNETGITHIVTSSMDGLTIHEYSSEDGHWTPDANTVNPNSGLGDPIFIDLTHVGTSELWQPNVSAWSAYNELYIENGDSDHYQMTVYNVLGQPLMREQINANATHKMRHGLPNGLYILGFQSNKHSFSVKLIVR